MKRRYLLFIMIGILYCSMLPTLTARAESNSNTSIAFGLDGVKICNQNNNKHCYIYYGDDAYGTPILWRLLDNNYDTNDRIAGIQQGHFFLQEKVIREGYVIWNNFQPLEMFALAPDYNRKDILSKPEFFKYNLNGQRCAIPWVLESDHDNWYVDSSGRLTSGKPDGTFGYRFVLDLIASKVLFTSAAVGGKASVVGELKSALGDVPNEWKLTVKDASRFVYIGRKVVSARPGGSVSLIYNSSNYGTKEYVSAILSDSSGKILYYVKLKNILTVVDTSGTVEMTLPADLPEGSYSLKVFSEQLNGDKCTDYASSFEEVTIKVDHCPPSISSLLPANSGDLPTSGTIELKFNEEMNTYSKGHVTLVPDASSNYKPSVIRGSWIDNQTYSFEYTNLAYDSNYAIKVSGFLDLAGNVMTEDIKYSFTTALLPSSPIVYPGNIEMKEGEFRHLSFAFGQGATRATSVTLQVVSPDIATVNFTDQLVVSVSGSAIVAGQTVGSTSIRVQFDDPSKTLTLVNVSVGEALLSEPVVVTGSAISTLCAVGTTGTSTTLNWTLKRTLDQFTYYELLMNGKVIALLSGEELTYLVNGLSPSATYQFTMKERNTYGISTLEKPTVTIATQSAGGSNGNSGSVGQIVNNNKANELPSMEGSDQLGWEAIKERIQSDKTGMIICNLNQTTILPREVIETLSESGVELLLKLKNGFFWVLKGKDIQRMRTSEEVSGILGETNIPVDINLAAELITNQIPAELITGLKVITTKYEETSVYQLRLSHEGEFGFRTALKLPLGAEHKGQIANLYYFNPLTKKLNYIYAGRIDDSGNVIFEFSHASDYMITLDDGSAVNELVQEIKVTTDKNILYVGGTTERYTGLTINLPEVLQKAIEDRSIDTKVSYQSSNSKIASVSKTGNVWGKSPGKARITTVITINGEKYTFQTNVTVKKAFIEFTDRRGSLKKGDKVTFQAVGYGITSDKIRYKTSNKSIIVINKATGRAVVKSVGTDYVIASAEGLSVKVKVTVK